MGVIRYDGLCEELHCGTCVDDELAAVAVEEINDGALSETLGHFPQCRYDADALADHPASLAENPD